MLTRVGLALAAAAVLLLVAAQVFLPRIAASTISSRVGRYGKVLSVKVSSWPAVRLLWGSADSVQVSAADLRLTPSQSADLLWESRGAARIDVSAASVREGPLRLTQATLRKRGDELSAQATVSEADARAALPPGFEVRLLGSGDGQVRVRATGGLFGVGASVQAVAGASEGALVAHPVGFLIEGLRLTLFSDPHVHVEGIGASEEGTSPPSYRVSMRARLR